jgi:hypothetical protein
LKCEVELTMVKYSSVEISLIKEAISHSEKRIEFEYDRFKLNRTKRLEMITLGTVGQLVFRNFLISNSVPHNFQYQAGDYDDFDFMIGSKVVEIKTSGFSDEKGWSHLHGIYNYEQIAAAERKNVDTCVQIFVNGYSSSDKSFDARSCNKAVIAGWVPLKKVQQAPVKKLPFGNAHLVPLGQYLDIDSLISRNLLT